MKILKRATFAIFLLTLLAFVIFYTKEKFTTDITIPQITVPEGVLEMSIKDTEDKLLEGLTAYDGRDGDITDRILVESVSKFITPGVCTVTYAVSDEDYHVSKATRTIKYTDYIAPEFYMKRTLVFAVDEPVEIREAIGARDCIDGDISDRVTVIATDYIENTVGVFTISVQVSNSMGDIIYLDVPVYVEDNKVTAPEILLEKNLIYVKKGEKPMFEDYIKEVTVNDKPMKNYGVLLSTNFNSEVPGTYNVHFYVSNSDGYEGHAVLTVIVEE